MYRCVSCFQGIIEKNYLYTVIAELNAICKIDIEQKKVKIEKWLDEEGDALNSYYSVMSVGGNLLLLPGSADHIGIYNFDTRTVRYIEIPYPQICTNEIYNSGDKFFCGFEFKDKIFVMGASYPAIMSLNLNAGKIDYITDWIDNIKDEIPVGDSRYYFSGNYIIQDNFAYIPCCAMAGIVQLNMTTGKTNVLRKLDNAKMIHGIVGYEEEIWILATTNHGSSLIEWLPDGSHREIIIEERQEKQVYWWNPLKIGKYIYIFQSNGGNVYRVDLREEEVELISEVKEAIGKIPDKKGRYLIRLIGVDDGKILFLTIWNKKWFTYNTLTGVIDNYVLKIEDDEYEKRYWGKKYQIERKKNYIDEENFPLNQFLRIQLEELAND